MLVSRSSISNSRFVEDRYPRNSLRGNKLDVKSKNFRDSNRELTGNEDLYSQCRADRSSEPNAISYYNQLRNNLPEDKLPEFDTKLENSGLTNTFDILDSMLEFYIDNGPTVVGFSSAETVDYLRDNFDYDIFCIDLTPTPLPSSLPSQLPSVSPSPLPTIIEDRVYDPTPSPIAVGPNTWSPTPSPIAVGPNTWSPTPSPIAVGLNTWFPTSSPIAVGHNTWSPTATPTDEVAVSTPVSNQSNGSTSIAPLIIGFGAIGLLLLMIFGKMIATSRKKTTRLKQHSPAFDKKVKEAQTKLNAVKEEVKLVKDQRKAIVEKKYADASDKFGEILESATKNANKTFESLKVLPNAIIKESKRKVTEDFKKITAKLDTISDTKDTISDTQDFKKEIYLNTDSFKTAYKSIQDELNTVERDYITSKAIEYTDIHEKEYFDQVADLAKTKKIKDIQTKYKKSLSEIQDAEHDKAQKDFNVTLADPMATRDNSITDAKAKFVEQMKEPTATRDQEIADIDADVYLAAKLATAKQAFEQEIKGFKDQMQLDINEEVFDKRLLNISPIYKSAVQEVTTL